MDEFLPIEHILKRDKQIVEHDLYQIIGEKDNNMCIFTYIGKYDHIPVVPIFDKTIGGYDCSLVSFLVTKEDIETNADFNMIGFFISKNKNIGACLMLTFVPDKNVSLDCLTNITGQFEVNLIQKQSNKTLKKNIKTYGEYMGKDESIYILTELLLDVI